MSTVRKAIIIGYIIAAVLIVNLLWSKQPYQGSIANPVQNNLNRAETITISGDTGNVELSLLAKYTLKGVIKSKKKYSDYPSQLAKYDYALAWGDLNKKEIDQYIKYSQSGRWYYYRYLKDCPVSREYISSHSANMHLVHQNQEVLKKIKKLRKNTYVQLDGYLVNVNFKDGPWRTSLSRTDNGNGACEIMYVTDIKTID